MAARRSALTGGLYWVGLLFVVVCQCGCSGGSDVDTYDVTGTLTYNGQPVANVAITFTPDGAGLAATGTTDTEGNFSELTTRESGDGIAEGDYTVTLSKITEVSDGAIEDPNAYAPATPGSLPFPTKYLNTAESDLKVTVNADSEKTLTLSLTD